MESPSKLAGMHVVSADIPRRRRVRLWITAPNDDQVFVDDARRSERNRLRLKVAPKILAQIDAARLAKRWDRMARFRIEAIETVHHAGKVAAMRAVSEVGKAACGLGTVNA